MFAYTNNRVGAFNNKLKEVLFGNVEEYYKFEFLTGCENFEFNGNKFWNSMDYIIVDTPKKVDTYIPGFIHLPGYKLNLYDSSNKCTEEVFMLSKDISKDYFDSLSNHIETTRLQALDMKLRKNPHSGKKWKEYYEIVNSFASPIDLYFDNRVIKKKSFEGGYASTVHRSQGLTVNNVFIDMKNILQCKNEQVKRQLQYVSLSRTKNNAYIMQ